MIFLRNRLKYALTYQEVKKIMHQRLIKIDGQVRTDKTYPAGFMGEITKDSPMISHSFQIGGDGILIELHDTWVWEAPDILFISVLRVN